MNLKLVALGAAVAAIATHQSPPQQATITPLQFGAKGDGFADDTVPLQTAISAAVATGSTLMVTGHYRVSAGLTALLSQTTGFRMVGASQGGTSIDMAPGAQGPLLHVVNSSGRFSGEISGITFNGPKPYGETPGQTGLVIENSPNFVVSRCTFSNFDVGLSTLHNCYGLSLYDVTAFATTCNVGLYLVGQDVNNVAGSGSDICVYNPWISGRRAAVWIGPNQGGFHFYGGQLAASTFGKGLSEMTGGIMSGTTYPGIPDTVLAQNAKAGSTSVTVKDASRLFRPPYLCQIGASQVLYTGLKGNTLTGIPATGPGSLQASAAAGDAACIIGGVSSVGFFGCSFEGNSGGWMVRSVGGAGWTFDECTFNSNQPNGPAIGAVKVVRSDGCNFNFFGCGFIGGYAGSSLFSVDTASAGMGEQGSFGGGTLAGRRFQIGPGSSAGSQSDVANAFAPAAVVHILGVSGPVQPGSGVVLSLHPGLTLALPPSSTCLGRSLIVKNVFQSQGVTAIKPAPGDKLEGAAAAVPLSGPLATTTLTATTYGWYVTAK